MRSPSLFALAAVLYAGAGPGQLRAQDPSDSTTLADSAVIADSALVADSAWEADSVIVRRPTGRSPGGNPYLREVRERRQGPPRRGAYYASLGLGAGSEAFAQLGGPAPYSSSRVRPTLDLAVGAGIGQALRIGLEGFVWFNILDDAIETVSAGMLGARVYPFASNGFYLRAAGGIGRYGVDLIDCGCSDPLVYDYGFAYALGGGLEAPVGRGVWLGPSFELIRMDVTGPDGYRERVLNFGITITFDHH